MCALMAAPKALCANGPRSNVDAMTASTTIRHDAMVSREGEVKTREASPDLAQVPVFFPGTFRGSWPSVTPRAFRRCHPGQEIRLSHWCEPPFGLGREAFQAGPAGTLAHKKTRNVIDGCWPAVCGSAVRATPPSGARPNVSD